MFLYSWPPLEDEVLSKTTSIPVLTTHLLAGILTKRAKKSSKVPRLVSSFGQDLLYHVTKRSKEDVKTCNLSILYKTEKWLEGCNQLG